MTFTAQLAAIRRQWRLLLAGTLAGILGAGAVVLFTPRTYDSTASVYVSPAVAAENSLDAYQGTLLSQQKIKAYTEIVVSDRLLRTVIDEFELDFSPAAFASHVAVQVDSESTLLRITVDDRSPQRAADLANAITTEFIRLVGELERPGEPGELGPVTVRVVDRARPSDEAATPRVELNLAAGLVLGLLLGVTAAVLRSASDTRLRTTAELADAAPARVLGVLPVDRAVKAGRLKDGLPPGAYGEAVRRVRTNLLFTGTTEPPTVLTVTSSTEEEGRTSFVVALAASFAPIMRVAVVEGDMRCPALGRRLGLSGSLGLADVLEGHVRLAEAVQEWNGGVDVLTSGTVPGQPSELLSSRRMGALLDELRASYDLVLLDAPALDVFTDAAVLAGRCDGAVLLCRAGTTRRQHVESSVETLHAAGALFVGSVLTMARVGRAQRRRSRSSTPAPPEQRTAASTALRGEGSSSLPASRGRVLERRPVEVEAPSG